MRLPPVLPASSHYLKTLSRKLKPPFLVKEGSATPNLLSPKMGVNFLEFSKDFMEDGSFPDKIIRFAVFETGQISTINICVVRNLPAIYLW